MNKIACKIFTGYHDRCGYGNTGRQPGGRSRLAHRVAWEEIHGSVPAGMCVCHACDVRDCINVEHLFLGTHADNMADRDAKGRGSIPDSRGSKHGRAKLNENDVRAIRTDSRFNSTIAREYGITRGAVSHIKNRTRWKHIT